VALAGLEGIAGLDLAAGLARSAGRGDLYQRLLRRFATDQAAAVATINAAATESRTDDAIRAAHTLKGTAGQIGADGLAAVAAEVESALRDGKPVDLAAVEAALQPLIAALVAALPPEPAKTGPETTTTTAPADPEAISTLADLLRAGDYQAVQQFARDRDRLQAALGADAFAELSRRIDAFEFDGAAALLGAALAG
jgi:two-component system sensor histidine kinase/response regulator